VPGDPETKTLRITWEDELLLPPEVSQERIHFNGACIAEAYSQPQLLPTDHLLLPPQEGAQDHWDWMRTIMRANGVDPDGLTYFDEDEDEWPGHETFSLSPDLEPGMQDGCKTNLKPYDLVVCAVLILAAHLCPEWLAISSDGNGQGEGWERALAWVRTIFDDPLLALPNFVR
jgi:hypothetical protein